MSFFRNALKYGPLVALSASPALVMAQADPIVTAATTALGDTKDNVGDVGVVIIGVIAAIVALTLVFGLLRKA